ncbi:HNH endonuclease signature motif containing protein [Aurantimonas coralicida]|uniref:HNH endonuclease signature motif containing protein n=1 Tax=Aurantimonas coralicida TaxID=182270 RepID=UPI001E3D1EE8|nr:HNH endonuclease signature motif containing protein [Aurantimonas coralicida]MCD1645252.1 HNH endonuclease [Aurantimonas coralicida]MCW7544905.1 HNH endonuclease [Aurantimonas litoralis]
MTGTCRIEGCERPVVNLKRQLCEHHYAKWKTYGDPEGGRPPKPKSSDPWSEEPYWRKARQRLFDNIEVLENGCWQWRGTFFTRNPYAQFSANEKTLRAHKFAYEALRGRVPDGLILDHLCRNTGCVNPAHLEPVTHQVNVLRGEGFAAENAVKTHCVNGHPFDAENTGYCPNGDRRCRACGRINAAAHLARRSPEQIARDRARWNEYDLKRREKKRADNRRRYLLAKAKAQ